jgi:plastocyanin
MRTLRSPAALAAVLLLSVVLVACGGSSSDGSSATTAPTDAATTDSISIKDLAFDPARLEVKAGAVVEISNDDSTTHTWTADDASWDAGDIAPGASAKHTFADPGTFAYHCKIHGSMKGTVVVSS